METELENTLKLNMFGKRMMNNHISRNAIRLMYKPLVVEKERISFTAQNGEESGYEEKAI